MSLPYPISVTATQIGTYFVGQYYKVVEQQPDYAHQFYTDASTVLRVQGNATQSATGLIQIHALIMSLKYTGFVVRTAHALESWSGGVLVIVSGSVQVKDFIGRKEFVETFFLAPQEKGYFVLNDVFHFIDEEAIHHHQGTRLVQNNLDSVNSPSTISEPVPSYLLQGEMQTTPVELTAVADVKDNGLADNYDFPAQQLQKALDFENNWEETSVEEPNVSFQNAMNAAQDYHPVSVVEGPAEEPVKHTYASILRVAKGQSTSSANSNPPARKAATGMEWNHPPQTTEETVPLNSFEKSVADTLDEVSAAEDEDEIRSVYVRNLLPDASEAEIEAEFSNFGKIAPDGVVIRSRKDVGVCYAFVEFGDMTGVHNAVKAGSASVAGRQVYIEERRPNSNIPSRLGRARGRGRSSYQIDATRGHIGIRNLGGGIGHNGGYRDYNNSRGNGYYKPVLR